MAKRPVIVPDLTADTTKPGHAGAELIVAWLFLALNESDVTYEGLAEHLGVSVETIRNWKHRRATPTLHHIVAALEHVGYYLTPVEADERPDPSTGYYPISLEWLRLVQAKQKQKS